MKNLTTWLNDNYTEIQSMTQKITRGSNQWEDVCHYAIVEFSERDDVLDVIVRGEGLKLLSGIIWRSFHSSTSPYHKVYRQKNRVHSLPQSKVPEEPLEEYDWDTDLVITQIGKIISDMKGDKGEKWYRAQLFEMWLDNPNFSDLSRQTGIPRTSISHAVGEAKEWIRQELKKSGITWKP